MGSIEQIGTEISMATALDACIKAAGSQGAFGKALGLKSQGTVSGMVRRGYIAARHVLAAERLWSISRHELRPDLYPPEAAAQAVA